MKTKSGEAVIEVVPIYGKVETKLDQDIEKYNHNNKYSEVASYSLRMIPMEVVRIKRGNCFFIKGEKCSFYLNNKGPESVVVQSVNWNEQINQQCFARFILDLEFTVTEEVVRVYIGE